jgi:hypothetical protein
MPGEPGEKERVHDPAAALTPQRESCTPACHPFRRASRNVVVVVATAASTPAPAGQRSK